MGDQSGSPTSEPNRLTHADLDAAVGTPRETSAKLDWALQCYADLERKLYVERERRQRAERERDEWQQRAVNERGLVASDAYERVREHITDELDRQAGAGAALSAATALATASQANMEAAERRAQRLAEALERIRALPAHSINRGLAQCHEIADAALASVPDRKEE